MKIEKTMSYTIEPPKLNIGCGHKTANGFTNVDIAPNIILDAIVDIDHDQLPFKSGSQNAVLASHVLEHVGHLEFVMEEIHRVLKIDGILEVYVPYGRNKAFNHVRFFWKNGPREIGNVRSKPDSELNPWKLILNEISMRSLPFPWHVQRYIHVNPNVGKARELHFILQKITVQEFEFRWKWNV